MEIPLIIHDSLYDQETVRDWQYTWETICLMTYENKEIVREIVTKPGIMVIHGMVNTSKLEYEHSEIYEKRIPINDEEITLDYMWKMFSNKHKDMQDLYIIEDFKHLHVPRALFENIGIKKWFEYSFPNCKVTYWNE